MAESKGLTPLHAVEDIASGQSRVLAMDLKPGTYVLICNHPGHFRRGMHRSFVVRGKTQGTTAATHVADSGGTQGVTATYDYTRITGEMGVIQVEVPTVWTDVDGKSGSDGAQVVASTNIDAFYNGWKTPGVRIVTAPQSGPADQQEFLDSNSWAQDACTLKDGRQPYHDSVYTGFYDSYTRCGGTSTAMVVIAARPADGSYEVLVTIKMVNDADRKALDQIRSTFKVTYPGNARG